MITPERDELFQVLRELASLCPDVRMGQLIVNLSYQARGHTHESIWDIEDDELLAAARKLMGTLQARQAVPAAADRRTRSGNDNGSTSF
jgi:hypothetical protein